MNIRSPYKPVMILAALMGLVCLVAWAYLTYASFLMKAEVSALSAQAESALARDAKTLSIKSALRDSRASVAAITGRFVTKDGIPAFIDMLEAKATEVGLKVQLDSINLDQNLHMHLVGTGPWKSAATYVSVLESLPYAISIDNLALAKIDGSNSKWNVSLDLVALVDHNSKNQ